LRDGSYDPRALARALEELPAGEPAVALLNIPSNPGGYSPTRDERSRLVDSLVEVAEQRPLLAVCDDAYTGLVFEEEIPAQSPFWDLVGRHPSLVPVKVDGVTKELSFFGGRVGFLTFPFEPDSEAAAALESKVKGLLRATLGSPVAASQMLVLEALESPEIEEQVESIRRELATRYRVLCEALSSLPAELLRPLPCNSGCFAVVELPEELGLEAETVRLHLLEHHDTGLVAIAPRYLRIAFCSVAASALPELVERLHRGVAELAADRRPT
jgi:aspartate/methionine/tyrosine aminotransferase